MRLTGVEMVEGVEVHQCEKPNNVFKTRYIVNGESPIAAGETGFGTWLANSGPVLYDNASGAPAIDEEWGAKADQWSLQKYRPGFIVTGGNENADGKYWTRAKQRIVTDLLGKNNATMSAGAGTVDFTLWMGNAGMAATEYDEFIARPEFHSFVVEDMWASIGLRHGVWYAVPIQCPPEGSGE